MPSRPTWFWTSFLSSIGVNAVLLASSACYIYSHMPVYLPGHSPDDVNGSLDAFLPVAPRLLDTLLGDAAGKGDSADANPGDEKMQSPWTAPEVQSFLSRDPQGPGKMHDEPSQSTQLPGDNAASAGDPAAMFGVAQAAAQTSFATPAEPSPPSPMFPSRAQPNSAQSNPTDTNPPTDAPPEEHNPDSNRPERSSPPAVAMASTADNLPAEPNSPPPSAASPDSPPSNSSANSAAESSQVSGGHPGPQLARADPAPQSDSESDPFAKEGSVKFKSGSTDVQFGRKHKLLNPRLGLAAQTDLMQLRAPITLMLALSLDESGNVTRVEILKSSGSQNVDQACKVAAYQWWIEPSKDKDGKPVKDVIPFTIGFT